MLKAELQRLYDELTEKHLVLIGEVRGLRAEVERQQTTITALIAQVGATPVDGLGNFEDAAAALERQRHNPTDAEVDQELTDDALAPPSDVPFQTMLDRIYSLQFSDDPGPDAIAVPGTTWSTAE